MYFILSFVLLRKIQCTTPLWYTLKQLTCCRSESGFLFHGVLIISPLSTTTAIPIITTKNRNHYPAFKWIMMAKQFCSPRTSSGTQCDQQRYHSLKDIGLRIDHQHRPGVAYIENDVCTQVTNCFSAHERVILVLISRVSCEATREINTKLTLGWEQKKFVTRVHTLFHFLHDITNP